MNNSSLKGRLIVMNFLEFAVWGAYLTSMGNYLGRAGMGAYNLYANANGHRSRSLCAAPTLIGNLPLLSRLIYDSPLRYGYAECTAQCRVVHHALYVERSLLYAYVGTVKHNSLHFAQNAWNGHRQRLSPYTRVWHGRFHRHHVVCQLCHDYQWLWPNAA